MVEVAELVVDVPGRRILDGVDLEIAGGEVVAVMGPSGSGKTTLLNCVSGLLSPVSGRVRVAGSDMTGATARERASLRLRSIGQVFQFGELLPELNVGDNIALPLMLMERPDARKSAARWLARMGLANRYQDTTYVLSGGETQRVAIARAMAVGPALVLADEPTGSLDRKTGAEVTGMMAETARQEGMAVLMATHDPDIASIADRVLHLQDARLAIGM